MAVVFELIWDCKFKSCEMRVDCSESIYNYNVDYPLILNRASASSYDLLIAYFAIVPFSTNNL